jgi:hypothetical protein
MNHFDTEIILILPPMSNVINSWRKRDPYLPKYLILNWLKIYYRLIPYVIRLFKEVLDVDILLFNSYREAIHYILKDLRENHNAKT